jgi:hypothetical protein
VQLGSIELQPPSNYALTTASANPCMADQTLGPGSKCEIAITFTPTGLGVLPGTLTVTDNAHNSPQLVTLTGAGVHGALAIAPRTLAFGNEPNGKPSTSKPVTLTNSSGVPLAIMSISSTDPEFVPNTSSCANQTLANGASCLIGVIFTPASKGAKHGTLEINDDATGSPQKVTMTGRGT